MRSYARLHEEVGPAQAYGPYPHGWRRFVPTLDLDAFANSKLGLAVASAIGRSTPPAVGLRLADRAADLLAARKESEIVRAVSSNLWVVSGKSLAGAALDAAVRETLRNSARFIYDFYRFADSDEQVRAHVRISPEFAEWMQRLAEGESAVFGAVHLASFELAGRALALEGFRAQVLSVPDPTEAYQSQNESRRDAGLEVTPISPASLKQAYRRLSQGGAVLTGVDRPLQEGGALFGFFGREARLPDVHVRLAARTAAPFVFVWIVLAEDGVYDVLCEQVPLAGGRGTNDIRADGEAILARAERVIGLHTAQWAMPHAVWPEALEEFEQTPDR